MPLLRTVTKPRTVSSNHAAVLHRMSRLCDLSIREAQRALIRGELCPVEYVESYISRIASLDSHIHAFLSVDGEGAISQAKALRCRRPTTQEPLFGIPFAVKDIIDVRGAHTTCQSRAFDYHKTADRDAECVARLRASGAIYLGKLSLDEFALAAPDLLSPWPEARNPWNVDFTPGSSSSGSGAAVAGKLIPLALGTDTGGSIRSPAMMNGVVGLKPTNGRIPMTGIRALAPSLDTVGPLARTVADISVAFSAMGGATLPDPCASGPRIGLADHLWRRDQIPSPDVTRSLELAVRDLAAAGANVIEVEVEALQRINVVGWLTLYAEAFTSHAKDLVRRPSLYGSHVRDSLLTGAFLSASDYFASQDLRARISASVDAALAHCDCLLTAVSARPPCRVEDEEAMAALANASVRILCNLSGHPALAIPAGMSDEGLPIGLQIIGRRFEEEKLLAIGQWIELRLSGWRCGASPDLGARPSNGFDTLAGRVCGVKKHGEDLS